jgi:hypothetical protein
MVFSILRQVAVFACFSDRFDHGGALLRLEASQFMFEDG